MILTELQSHYAGTRGMVIQNEYNENSVHGYTFHLSDKAGLWKTDAQITLAIFHLGSGMGLYEAMKGLVNEFLEL